MNLTPFFKLEIIDQKAFVRNDEDHVVNLILTEKSGQKYFLKEVQAHSWREGLDEIYLNLNSVIAKNSSWILPLARHDDQSKFIFEREGKQFLLFTFVKYRPFSKEDVSLTHLWNCLEEFHQLIKNKKFPKQDYRTYQSWLEMGSRRLKKKFGDDLPFLSRFDDFMENRFSKIQFYSGPIHWDIYEDNLGLDENGRLIILDFDLVQEGTYAQEFIYAASLYLDWEKGIDENLLDELYRKISPLALGLKREDLIFLVTRPTFGDFALLKDRDQVITHLNKLQLNFNLC